jgi:hypothetical protein
MPDNIPADVAAKIAVYQSKKSALKKQLYDTVYQFDGSGLGFFRGSIRALADKQQGPLAELEALAEEIRRGMTQVDVTARRMGKSPLPAALSVRVDALLRDRAEAQRITAAKVEELLGRHADVRVSYKFEDESLKFVVLPWSGARRRERGAGPDLSGGADVVTQELSAIAEDFSRRVAELLTERTALRKEIAIALGLTSEAGIDQALGAAAKAFQQQETASAYDEYRSAVFEPGLSIEQRRLLLDEAVQRLNLPLPRGDLQPTRRGNAW